MTTDPLEALASQQRIREARRALTAQQVAVDAMRIDLLRAKSRLRDAERDFHRLLDGELADLPLFDAAAPAPIAVPAGQPPGTVGHAKGARFPSGHDEPVTITPEVEPYQCGDPILIDNEPEAKDGPPPGKPTKPTRPKATEAETVALNLLLCEAIELVPMTTMTLARDRGLSDQGVAEMLSTAWGAVHDHYVPTTGLGFTVQGGSKPQFWAGAFDGLDVAIPKSDLKGPALIARVRQLAGIPTPSKASRVRRLNKRLDRDGRADQRRVESTRPSAEGVSL